MLSSETELLGSQQPTLLHLPQRRITTAGAEAIGLASLAGLDLDEWQAWYLVEGLMESDRRSPRTGELMWSASECGLIVPRQNGKGSILEARQLAGLFLIGEKLQVHTAHEFKTCYEHFLRITSLIEDCPELDAMIMRIRRGAGEQAIELKRQYGGGRLRFLARSGGSGRGLSAPTLYLDEAYALTAEIMGALIFARSAQPNPQTWYTSSAPKATSAVLHSIRLRALAGEAENPRLLLASWENDVDCNRHDRENWRRSNPGLGIRIAYETIEDELLTFADMPEEFDRERLGIPSGVDGATPIIPLTLWNSLLDESYVIEGAAALAIDVSVDQRWSSIVACQIDNDGIHHVEVVDRQPGTSWLAARVIKLCEDFETSVTLAVNGPSVAQIETLESAGVTVNQVTAADIARAIAGFIFKAENRMIGHLGNVSLQDAVSGAAIKEVGDLQQLSRLSSTADISALIATILALDAEPPLPSFAG